jgi:hypothetical protein
MGNPDHIAKAKEGVNAWNAWRSSNLRVQPNLTRADLSNRDLRNIDFRGVGLFKTNLTGANLAGAILRQSIMIGTKLCKADLTGAQVYGVSVWDVDLTDAIQRDLVITPPNTSAITVDNLEVAQFIYLLISNAKLRQVIDTVTAKVVLILGNFSPSRKPILDAVRDALRELDYVPVLFDFAGPENRGLTETVRILAHLARFVIADLSNPRSIPHELQAIVPEIDVPVAPMILASERPYAMFADLAKYSWLLKLRTYANLDDVVSRVLGDLLVDVESRARKRRAHVAVRAQT